ncbi:hypothetical protein COCON_G00095860 [Conger conger]|uniref:Uncharacterized protein n=1 Tax=Conger conger TaxID=82655 RepID=A0A9Q1DM26_CONCO|nr:hypothetical protein COCON_G00095860 [Conger conger]
MTNEQKCMVEKIDVEALISMKYQLKQKKLLEPILSTNLDYAVALQTYRVITFLGTTARIWFSHVLNKPGV